MSFSLNTHLKDEVVVIALSGRLTLGEPSSELRKTVGNYLESGSRLFVLDVGGVSYMDSGGLGELIACYTSIRNRGGNVNLLKLAGRMRGLIQMTKLATVFDSYDGELAAVAALHRAESAASAGGNLA